MFEIPLPPVLILTTSGASPIYIHLTEPSTVSAPKVVLLNVIVS
nr:MAG TPA: hypothetical protein [Crassvirales sp.]